MQHWINQPPRWERDGDRVIIHTEPNTDYWRTTKHGFIKDDGHFFYQPASGHFIASVTVRGDYNALYDQAGLMVRLDERHWMKCGVEFVDGVQYANAVVTRDFSDWSVVALRPAPAALRLRVTRGRDHLEVHWAADDEPFTMIREAYFPPAESLSVGLLACSPKGAGFRASFESFAVI
jgi:hypothetical protein